jgi:hypothetical protein
MSAALPAAFWQGIEQFNQREFYACHDTLEAIWMEASEPERTLYQGILQIAVAFYHLSHQNGRGAMILLGEGMNRLRGYGPDYGGVEIGALLARCQGILHQIQMTEPEAWGQLWATLSQATPTDAEGLPLIQYQ